jgi:segregation and condensation protein B
MVARKLDKSKSQADEAPSSAHSAREDGGQSTAMEPLPEVALSAAAPAGAAVTEPERASARAEAEAIANDPVERPAGGKLGNGGKPSRAADAEESATEPDESISVALPSDAKDEEIARVAAALLFASDKPITAARLAELLGHGAPRIRAALASFEEKLASIGAPFHVTEIASGYRFLTDESYAKYVSALRGEQRKERLSAAALETLAIIAYRQPITKGEVEGMRGVQAGPILRSLLERRLVRVTGRAQVPGRPLQYGTTKEFLDRFHLASLKDLPTVEELAKP